jgi:ABC-type antimicrobial peptide transport system permease subunit
MQVAEYVRLWRRFCRNKGAVFGLAVFVAVVFMAVFADVISPHNPLEQNYARLRKVPRPSTGWAPTASGATC